MCISLSLQVLIVAGGLCDSNLLSSTEKLNTGATAWTTIKPLPRKLWGVATVSLDKSIVLLGKVGMVLCGGIITILYCRGA